MTDAYERPYRPVALNGTELKDFAFQPMMQKLWGEPSLRSSGRAALTLVHGDGLTAVLTVAHAGTHYEAHDAGGPTLYVVLSGSVTVGDGSAGARILVEAGGAVALGPRLRHAIDAESDCAFLTIIGERETG